MDYCNIIITTTAIEKWRVLCKNSNTCSDENIKEKIKCAIDNGTLLSPNEIICFDLVFVLNSDMLIDIKRYYECYYPITKNIVSRIFKIKSEFEYLGDNQYKKLTVNPPTFNRSKLKHSERDFNMIKRNFDKDSSPKIVQCSSIGNMYYKLEELKSEYNDFVFDKLKLNLYCWYNPYYKHAHIKTIELDESWRKSKYKNYSDKINILKSIEKEGFGHVRIDGDTIYYKR